MKRLVKLHANTQVGNEHTKSINYESVYLSRVGWPIFLSDVM